MPPRKRQLPDTPPQTSSSRRRSTRISSSGQKSRYFEADSDEETSEIEGEFSASKPRSSRGKPSAKKAKIVVDDDDDDDEDAYQDEEPEENGAQEEDEEEDDDEDAGPRVTIIPKPKLRDIGGVPYEDEKLHKNTLLFLKDLKANNKRSWLKLHDAEYRRSLKDWESFVETMTQKIAELDETIPELPVKDVIFRIYRDVRFSKDPTPYKPHYSAAWSRTGRKGPYACYYIHCEPGNIFVGGGLWHPEASHVQKLRASIDERPRRWRRVLMDDAFRRTFLPKAKNTEESVIKAFTQENKGNALKTKPKGFIPEHRDIELLKLRNFTVGKKISDNVLTAQNAQEQIAEIVQAMVPFVTFLNDVVMPDLNNLDEDSSDDE